jgi:hypothetical protein
MSSDLSPSVFAVLRRQFGSADEIFQPSKMRTPLRTRL